MDDAERCLERVLQRVSDKWTKHALDALSSGPKRFGELRRELRGISTKVLTELVRSLVREGLLHRQVVTQRPLQVEYGLTQRGNLLVAMISEMLRWVRVNMIDSAAFREHPSEAVSRGGAVGDAAPDDSLAQRE
jgi:DNA-binding HxlR family transcriptional regulator